MTKKRLQEIQEEEAFLSKKLKILSACRIMLLLLMLGIMICIIFHYVIKQTTLSQDTTSIICTILMMSWMVCFILLIIRYPYQKKMNKLMHKIIDTLRDEIKSK